MCFFLIDISKAMIFPISFSIPVCKVLPNNSSCDKTKLLSSLIPGEVSTYIYPTEDLYYQEYQRSWFAVTRAKAGWDCLRHYEILANGCIPLFVDIENCPENTMFSMPKKMLIEAHHLYDEMKGKDIKELDGVLLKKALELRGRLLAHTQEFLTTKATAHYLLSKSNNSSVTSVLFLSGSASPDYLRCLTLHGLKSVLGAKCHDFPKIQHIYKGNFSHLYGKGMSYTNLLPSELHDNKADNTIERDITEKKYDLVIYGSFHRGMLFYDLVNQHYSPDKIILFCGEDFHECTAKTFNHPVFVRELI